MKTITNIKNIKGKILSMYVAQDIVLNIKVKNEDEIDYQFIGIYSGRKDDTITTKLEIAYDDIEGAYDYSFKALLNIRYFLFQFSDTLTLK